MAAVAKQSHSGILSDAPLAPDAVSVTMCAGSTSRENRPFVVELANRSPATTLTPARSGMPAEHFGIRIAEANKDKLVGELDVDDRHLNNSGHVHGGALAVFADHLGEERPGQRVAGVSDNYDRIEDEYLSRLRARAADRRCRAGR